MNRLNLFSAYKTKNPDGQLFERREIDRVISLMGLTALGWVQQAVHNDGPDFCTAKIDETIISH